MKRFGEVVSIFLSSKAVTRVIERLILVHFGKHCIDIWRLGINVKKKSRLRECANFEISIQAIQRDNFLRKLFNSSATA